MLAIEQAAFRARELADPRHADPRRVVRYGYKAYSQTDEDGIIAEIFRRIGASARTFVEIGVENGTECNSLWLLVQGWNGLWIEADPERCRSIRATHRPWLETGALRLVEARADAATVDRLLLEHRAGEVDLLSIDVDGIDYWLWRAIESISPRVVVIEYNASWPPPVSITVPDAPEREWNLTNWFGASLSALARLGERKGYALVGCNLAGVDAFFVRHDLVGDHFLSPGSAEDHYEPPRYFLAPMAAGHPPFAGPVVTVD